MDNDKPLTIEEIHEGTLEVIKKLIEICDEINVNYFVAYGSLIGAVRHKGFIPWDDDFDVIMLRPDYDKFCRYCDEHEKELYPFKLMNYKNTPDYPFTISRLNDLRYRMESVGYPDAGMGLFIDIYPYDGCGNKYSIKYKIIERIKTIYEYLLGVSYLNKFQKSSKGLLRTCIKYIFYTASRFMSTKFILQKMDNLRFFFDYDKSNLITLIGWIPSSKPIEKDNFLDYIYLEFEGIKVKAPKNYDYILTQYYGNYMELPSLEKRVPHHGYELYLK